MKIMILRLSLLICFLIQISIYGQSVSVSICGGDDREETIDKAVGRIWLRDSQGVLITTPQGTAFIIKNGKLITSGHVLAGQPGGIVEFNVPGVSPQGEPNSNPEDRYEIIQSSIIYFADQNDFGNDWAVFEVEPNQITSLTPLGKQDTYYPIMRTTNLQTIRITGCGKDTNEPEKNYIRQTAIGDYAGSDGSKIKYIVDTEGGNSGSPIIDECTGYALGVHGFAGCQGIEGYNGGTSFYNEGFWDATGLGIEFSVDQERESGTRLSGENIYRWESCSFKNYTIQNNPILIKAEIGSTEVLKGQQDKVENPDEKYNRWINFTDVKNHQEFLIDEPRQFISKFGRTYSGVTIQNYFLDAPSINPETDVIGFKDPWFIDYPDPDYGSNRRNRGMDNLGNDALIFRDRNSPFNPNFIDTYEYGQTHQGVFLLEGYPSWDPPYYSIRSSIQDIFFYNTGNPSGRYHKFYFQNWTYDPNKISLQTPSSNETGVVFKTLDAVLTANLKGTQLSQNSNAYNTNSQRKYVKTDDGYLHCVYESMGKVWYELSSNSGVVWTIQNNGNPISTSGKQPAIDYHYFYDSYSGDTYHQTVIVWQEQYGSNSKIKIAYFHREFDTPAGKMEWFDTDDVASVAGTYSSTNCTPVVSYYGSDLKVVFKNGNSGALMCRQGLVNIVSGTYLYGSGPTTLTSTNSNSVNPSIAVNKSGTTTVRLVWEQITDASNSSIKYAVIVAAQISGTIATISTGSGYPLNFSPSISVANNFPVVSWIVCNNSGGGETYKRVATSRGTTWGTFQISGTEVNFVNNNSATSAAEKTVIVWSENATNPTSKWMKRTSTVYSTPASLSNSGIQSQVCGGTDYQYMSAMVFKNTSLPYYFLKSTTDFSVENPGEEDGGGFNKITETDTIVTFGRSGVADINGVEFAFNNGDILVGDSIIKFIEMPDTLVYSSFNELNGFTRTENFSLSPSTEFYFSNIYYTVQKSNPDSALNEVDAVNFKAELVNASTNHVAGTFDNITYNKNNLEKYASIDYQVDCSGITAGDYYLRLVTTVTGEAGYSLANIVNDNTTLAKKNYQVINFTGSEIPITYSLEQNYPNPFNPTTTIRYQLPKDGMVTLKIYDILGAEVTTLVDEEKIAGKYEVNFNASNFASGIYIYRLKVNDYVNVKKMVLLK